MRVLVILLGSVLASCASTPTTKVSTDSSSTTTTTSTNPAAAADGAQDESQASVAKASARKDFGIRPDFGTIPDEYANIVNNAPTAGSESTEERAKNRLRVLRLLTQVKSYSTSDPPDTILRRCEETASWNQTEIETANYRVRWYTPIGAGLLFGGMGLGAANAVFTTSLFDDDTKRFTSDTALPTIIEGSTYLVSVGTATAGVWLLTAALTWAPSASRQAEMQGRSAAAQRAYGGILAAQTVDQLEEALKVASKECFFSTALQSDAEIASDLKAVNQQVTDVKSIVSDIQSKLKEAEKEKEEEKKKEEEEKKKKEEDEKKKDKDKQAKMDAIKKAKDKARELAQKAKAAAAAKDKEAAKLSKDAAAANEELGRLVADDDG